MDIINKLAFIDSFYHTVVMDVRYYFRAGDLIKPIIYDICDIVNGVYVERLKF